MRSNLIRAHRSAAFAVFVALFASAALAQAPDPHIGVWKFIPAKSQAEPGPMGKSATSTWAAVAEGTKVTAEGVAADGTPLRFEWTMNYDGKDAPVTGTNGAGETVSSTRIDARTVRLVMKTAGKVMTTQTSVVSPDGKTRTATTIGVNAAGQKVHNIGVYEKQ